MANTIPRVPHLIGTNKVVVLEDVYSNIGDICGIHKIGDDNPLPQDYDSYKSPIYLYKTGVIRRAKVVLSNGKIRVIYIVAANTPKIGALISLEYQQGITIKSAHFPLHKVFG